MGESEGPRERARDGAWVGGREGGRMAWEGCARALARARAYLSPLAAGLRPMACIAAHCRAISIVSRRAAMPSLLLAARSECVHRTLAKPSVGRGAARRLRISAGDRASGGAAGAHMRITRGWSILYSHGIGRDRCVG